MGGFVARILTWLIGRLFNRTPPQSAEAAEAQTVGQATVSLNVEKQTNAEVEKAVQAARASDDRAARDPCSLRAPDPDSRD